MTDREDQGGSRVDDEALARYVRDAVSRYEVPATIGRGASAPRRELGHSLGMASKAAFVLIAVIVATAVIRPAPFDQREGTNGSSALPSVNASPPAAASADASASESLVASDPAGPVDLGRFFWFNIETVGPCPPTESVEGMSACAEPGAPILATIKFEAGSLDGRHRKNLTFALEGVDQPADLRRARPSAFLGADGEVFYTANDERGGALRSVKLSTGAHTERFRSEELIQSAVYDRVDGTVIATLVSAGERRDRGIWRLDLATGSASRIIEPRTDLDFTLRADGWSREVFLTPDSRRIVSLDCVDRSCEARVFEAKTGALATTATRLRNEEVHGVTDRALIGLFDCPQRPCRITALGLDDGSLKPLVSPCAHGLAALAAGSGAAASLGIGAVGDSTCDTHAVLAVETETGKPRTAWIARSPGERQLQIIQRQPYLGYSAPDGWIMLGPGGGFKPATVDETADPILLDLVHGGVVALVIS